MTLEFGDLQAPAKCRSGQGPRRRKRSWSSAEEEITRRQPRVSQTVFRFVLAVFQPSIPRDQVL